MRKYLLSLFSIFVIACAAFINVSYSKNIKPNNTYNVTTGHSSECKKFTKSTMTVPYEMKVLIEDKYAYYSYSSGRLTYLVEFLQEDYGFTVTETSVTSISYNKNNISNYWLYILPNPRYGNLTATEREAVRYFVNNSRGYAWILGYSNYNSYLNNYTLNNISEPFGIHFIWGSATDPDNNTGADWRPLVYVWANTTPAQYLSENGTYVLHHWSPTAVDFPDLSLNGTWVTFYRLGIGDDNTSVDSVATGPNVTYNAIAITESGGIMFASGCSAFISDYDFYDYDNEKFIYRLVEYGLRRDLAITKLEAPTTDMLAGQTFYVNVTVINNADNSISNVHVGLEFSGAIELKNTSNIYNISSLNPSETADVSFEFVVTGTSEVYMEVKVWSDNSSVIGYQKRVEFNTRGLILSSNVEPEFIVLSDFNYTYLHVYIENPAENPIATDVNVSIMLPSELTTDNDTFYHFEQIINGTTEHLILIIEALEAGRYRINVSLISDNMGTAFTHTYVIVYSRPFILFDQGHGQYYDADRMTGFVDLLKQYGELYLNNDTITKDELGNASLIIITNPSEDDLLSDAEIQLIKNYIDNGGKLIIMGTWFKYIADTAANLNNITMDYGIRFEVGEIADNISNYGEYYLPILYNLAKHPLCSDVDHVFTPGTTYLSLSRDAKAVVKGNPTSYGLENYSTHSGVDNGALVAVATVELDGGGKIVALGGGGILADSYYGTSVSPIDDNMQFARNLLMWILGDTIPPTVTITCVNLDTSVLVTVTVVDNLAIDNVNISDNDTIIKSETGITSHQYVYVFDITEAGIHVIRVIAIDYAGLAGFAEETVEVVSPPATETTTPTEKGVPMWLVGTAAAVAVGIVVIVMILLRKKKE